MLIPESSERFLLLVARAADICCKPWRHSVVNKTDNIDSEQSIIDITMIVQCRNEEGVRFPENDIEVEIYKSGTDLFRQIFAELNCIYWYHKI